MLKKFFLLIAISFLPLNCNCNNLQNTSIYCSNSNNNIAYRSQTIQYANMKYQYLHNNNYKVNANAWNGPVYTGYWGWGFNNPFDAIQIMKDSGFKNFTFGFLNQIDNEGLNKNLGANYLDQIQEIHKMGGNVTFSFGGFTVNDKSFFNIDPSSSVMYSKLRNLCLGYHINSLDFDLEYTHTLDNKDDQLALLNALVQLRYFLKTNLNEDLHIRFTQSQFSEDLINNVSKIWGSKNVIWNDMYLTGGNNKFQSQNLLAQNNESNNNYILQILDSDKNQLKALNLYNKMSDIQIFHHLGITGSISNQNAFSLDKVKDFLKSSDSKQMGLLGIWSISNDHSSTSIIDPQSDHKNSAEKNDFEYTNTLQNSFENKNYNFEYRKYNKKPNNIKDLSIYQKNHQYITLQWQNDPNVKYYNLIDLDSTKIICSVDRNFASLSIREHPEYKNKNIFNLGIQAINNKGKSKVSQIKNINISSTINGQIEYWDANIKYNNTQINSNTYIPLVEYIYYNGNIYQDINRTSEGISNISLPPNQNIKDWKFVGKATDLKFGLSSAKIQDLKSFEWNQSINKISKLITVNYNENQTILPNKTPYFINL